MSISLKLILQIDKDQPPIVEKKSKQEEERRNNRKSLQVFFLA